MIQFDLQGMMNNDGGVMLAGAAAAAVVLGSTLANPSFAADSPASVLADTTNGQQSSVGVADRRSESQSSRALPSSPALKGNRDYQLPPGNEVHP